MTKTMTIVKFKVKSGFDNDFVDAIKSGATDVRIGSAIFGQRG